MAEILSVAAILAIAFAGKKMNDAQTEHQEGSQNAARDTFENMVDTSENFSTVTGSLNGSGEAPGVTQYKKFEQDGTTFADIKPDRNPGGGLAAYLSSASNPYVSQVMNNLSPVEKSLVGPGLGVAADVPATGGFQQLFRPMPNNVGAYRLTTLPGRSGAPGDITGGRGGIIGQMTHNMPEKTAYLPERLPPVRGRGQGEGGALTGEAYRGSHEKTKRLTSRSTYGYRSDGLGFAPAKSIVSAEQLHELPTRNKSDASIYEFSHMNNPAPGVSTFASGFVNDPRVQLMEAVKNGNAKGYTAKQLEQFGIRPSDKRCNKDRMGNAAHQNVRMSPLNQGGAITAVREDTSRVDGRMNAAEGGRMQQYYSDFYQNNNAYKGMVNPRASDAALGVAHRQMDANPFSTSVF